MTYLPGPDTLVYNATPPAPADGDEVPLQGDASANLKVVVENTVPVPATVSGTVTANQGGSWSATVTQGTAANLNATVAQGAAGASAWKVDGSAVTQPVSGTVTANAGTNLNTSALALESGGNLAGIVTRLGDVTANPTANTVLDRLKALLTGIVLAAGSNIIGKVGIDQTTPGTTNAVAPISGQAGVAGGAGATGATTQRVVLATDTAIIGATNETAPASDTASSGLNGRLQRVAQRLTSLIALVPAALTGSGNFKVAVVESTATQTVSGTVTANQGGTWTVATNADGTIAAGAAASRALAVGGIYNSTEPSPTTGQGLALQLDAKGRQRQVIMDAAGNTRGANVNASNQLSVSVDGNALSYAQGSTTSGQTGQLTQGAATTSAPSYTSGQTDPLSLTTKGGLREAAVDYVGNEFDYTGPTLVARALLNPSDLSAAVVNISSATTTAIVAAVAGQTTRVHRLRLNVGAAQQITVKDGSTTLEVLNFTAAGFLTYDVSSRPWYTTSVNSALNFTTSTTGQVNGVVEYQTGP